MVVSGLTSSMKNLEVVFYDKKIID